MHIAKSFGEKQMNEIQHSLPDGFYSTIPKIVVFLNRGKGIGSTENVETYNTKLIYQ